MRTFTNQKIISTVKRLTYSGTPSIGTSAIVLTNLNCYLRPLSEELSAINQVQWGQGFTIITEVDSELLVGDIISIDDETYTIRGLAKHDRGRGTAYYKYLAVKGQR